MFIFNAESGYDKDGQQWGSGYYLMLCDERLIRDGFGNRGNPEMRAIVRHVHMHQLGHWMMGTMRVGSYETSLSGPYGSDGLPQSVPAAIYRQATPVPQELVEAWNKGGGHNSAGNEAAAMRAWALANLDTLRTPKKYEPIPDEHGPLDKPDSYLPFWYARNVDKKGISYVALAGEWVLDGPYGFWGGGAAIRINFQTYACQFGAPRYKDTPENQTWIQGIRDDMWRIVKDQMSLHGWQEVIPDDGEPGPVQNGEGILIAPTTWRDRLRYLAGFGGKP